MHQLNTFALFQNLNLNSLYITSNVSVAIRYQPTLNSQPYTMFQYNARVSSGLKMSSSLAHFCPEEYHQSYGLLARFTLLQSDI